jgi:hypothetical protein
MILNTKVPQCQLSHATSTGQRNDHYRASSGRSDQSEYSDFNGGYQPEADRQRLILILECKSPHRKHAKIQRDGRTVFPIT